MSVKNVISWHSAFTCSFGTLSPGLKSYLVHQVVKWEESMPITPWWPTLKTKNNVIFWIYLRILHQISVTTRKLITCFKGFTKKCSISNLVYISVNFQAIGSVQISLNFSFKYNSNGIHYFFPTIIDSKVMKANVKKAGNVTCQLQYRNYNESF